MTAIGVKELKATAGELVRRVESGERILVTRRGRPVAALVPIHDPDSLYDRVLAELVAPSLKVAERDFATGGAVTLSDWKRGGRRTKKKSARRR